MPSSSVRNAINAGLRVLPRCEAITTQAEEGDELRVDFSTGDFWNLTRGTHMQFIPLGEIQRGIVERGGWRAAFMERLIAFH
jgi:3-isopropylmalate/(R)-2-methylmalate dehydratase small subunit